MVIKVQRWHPDTCQCIIEQQVDYSQPEPKVEFLMINTICDKHKGFASTKFKPNHAQLSSHVLNLIEQAKESNLKQLEEQIANAKTRKQRKDLERCRPLIQQHNQDITEEWQELVEREWAFDSHVHDMVLKENRLASQQKKWED